MSSDHNKDGSQAEQQQIITGMANCPVTDCEQYIFTGESNKL